MFLKKKDETNNLATALNIAEKEIAKNQLITKLVGLEKARCFSKHTAKTIDEQLWVNRAIGLQMRKYVEEYCKKYEPWAEEE